VVTHLLPYSPSSSLTHLTHVRSHSHSAMEGPALSVVSSSAWTDRIVSAPGKLSNRTYFGPCVLSPHMNSHTHSQTHSRTLTAGIFDGTLNLGATQLTTIPSVNKGMDFWIAAYDPVAEV